MLTNATFSHFPGITSSPCVCATRYDGKLVLNLEAAEEGGYIVTSPLDPELITQAETLEGHLLSARRGSGSQAVTA